MLLRKSFTGVIFAKDMKESPIVLYHLLHYHHSESKKHPPFSFTGVDFAGSLYHVKIADKPVRYVSVFIHAVLYWQYTWIWFLTCLPQLLFVVSNISSKKIEDYPARCCLIMGKHLKVQPRKLMLYLLILMLQTTWSKRGFSTSQGYHGGEAYSREWCDPQNVV